MKTKDLAHNAPWLPLIFNTVAGHLGFVWGQNSLALYILFSLFVCLSTVCMSLLLETGFPEQLG